MLPTRRICESLLIASGVFLGAASAEAQTTRAYWTLEARIAEADGVVRGTIVNLSRKVLVPPGGKTPDGVSWPDGKVEYTGRVKVDEVLKGDGRDNLGFTKTASAFDRTNDQWCKAKTPFLWFLTRDKEGVHLGTPIRLGKPVAAEAHYRHGVAPPLFSTDFVVLKEPEDILARARAYARISTRRLAIHRLTVPRVVADRCAPSGDWNFVLVPVEPSLEQLAKRLIASPQAFVPKRGKLDARARAELRVAGVDALRHFKSGANTALLRSLLEDPTGILHTPESGAAVLRYPVRAKSHEVLSGWGVRVPMPVVEIAVPAGAKGD